MTFPVVYDMLMRIEIEAQNPVEAERIVAEDIATRGIRNSVQCAFEIIRDDNENPPKDVHSRHVNGFAIFTSEQKLELVTKIVAALDAAGKGNRDPGDELLANLAKQFAYLDNSGLEGTKV